MYKHLTREQRYSIYRELQNKMSLTAIANMRICSSRRRFSPVIASVSAKCATFARCWSHEIRFYDYSTPETDVPRGIPPPGVFIRSFVFRHVGPFRPNESRRGGVVRLWTASRIRQRRAFGTAGFRICPRRDSPFRLRGGKERRRGRTAVRRDRVSLSFAWKDLVAGVSWCAVRNHIM